MNRLEQLRTFLEAYRLGSFSRAADELHVTQPSVSMHIAALEGFVDKPLFVRQARGVVATEAADELARAIGPLLDGLEIRLASYRHGPAAGGTVHLAGPPDFMHTTLAGAMQSLLAQDFRLRVHTGDRERLYALLESSAVDLAITASVPNEHRYGYAHLLTERLLLVLPPAMAGDLSHPPTASELAKLPLIAFDEDLPLIRTLWTCMFQCVPTLQAKLTVADLRIIRDLVIQGQGWSVLPDYQCTQALADGALISMTPLDQAPTNNLYLVWNKAAMRKPGFRQVRDSILASFQEAP